MFKTTITIAVIAAVTLSSGSALAASNSAILTIQQSDGTDWTENISGLLVIDTNKNFTMLTGASAPTNYYQDGNFKTAVTLDTSPNGHPDYWQWKDDATLSAGGYWNWHSAETLDGTKNTPWQAVLKLNNVSGHGDPDLSYAISAINNNTYTQTYSFTVGEVINPTVNSANVVHADIAGALSPKTVGNNATISPFGTNGAIQQFQLSSDGGATFVTAGVDVGPGLSATSTTAYGTFADDKSGPTGATWDYMQILTKFTLTAKSNASLVGYASITPVPEPESHAMMLAGLALVAGMARRRKH